MGAIEVLDRGAAAHPDRACLVCGEQTLSYAELRDRSRRIAQRLRTDHPGVVHGAVLAPNDADGFACALGLLRAGVTWLPVNARDAPATIGEQLGRFDADLLFVHSAFAAVVPVLRTAAPRLGPVIVYDTELDAWLGDVPAADVARADDPGRTVAIFATSGTSGTPKGVELSARAFDVFIDAFETINPHGDVTPVYLAAAPLTHVSGRICLAVMGAGGTTVVLERATPDAIVTALESHGVTITFLPPTAIHALLAGAGDRSLRFPELRYIGYGSAPMRVDMTRRALAAFGPVLIQGYGQTEAPMLITSLPREEHLVDGLPAPDERLSSVGRPTPFTTLAILDADGGALPDGEVGEVCVRGDYLMTGYYGDPEGTAAVRSQGWHHTGDLGFLDAEGYLHLVDRLKDMLISGGFNVYPAEVERCLREHPGVRECAVVGVPDEHWGEAVAAVVVAATDPAPAPEALIAFCRARLGAVKTPKRVVYADDLPRTTTGKVRKQDLRAELLRSALTTPPPRPRRPPPSGAGAPPPPRRTGRASGPSRPR